VCKGDPVNLTLLRSVLLSFPCSNGGTDDVDDIATAAGTTGDAVGLRGLRKLWGGSGRQPKKQQEDEAPHVMPPDKQAHKSEYTTPTEQRQPLQQQQPVIARKRPQAVQTSACIIL